MYTFLSVDVFVLRDTFCPPGKTCTIHILCASFKENATPSPRKYNKRTRPVLSHPVEQLSLSATGFDRDCHCHWADSDVCCDQRQNKRENSCRMKEVFPCHSPLFSRFIFALRSCAPACVRLGMGVIGPWRHRSAPKSTLAKCSCGSWKSKDGHRQAERSNEQDPPAAPEDPVILSTRYIPPMFFRLNGLSARCFNSWRSLPSLWQRPPGRFPSPAPIPPHKRGNLRQLLLSSSI